MVRVMNSKPDEEGSNPPKSLIKLFYPIAPSALLLAWPLLMANINVFIIIIIIIKNHF